MSEPSTYEVERHMLLHRIEQLENCVMLLAKNVLDLQEKMVALSMDKARAAREDISLS